MILHLSEEVNYAMIDNLAKSINSLTKEDILHIYFTSTGGSPDVSEAFIKIVNLHKESIVIHFYGEIFSAAMIIFMKCDCKKEVLPDTRGMYHFSWQQLTIAEGGKPTDTYDIFSLSEMKKSKLRTIEYLSTTKLTAKEITSIKKGKDVYFSYSRMIELI